MMLGYFKQCPVPNYWTEVVGDYCGVDDNGRTCWHFGTCSKCYRCPCHCKCPPVLGRIYTQYELDFMEQSKHYYDSGRD